MNINRFLIVILLASSALLLSCSKKNNDDAVNTPTVVDKGEMFLHIHNYMDGTDMGEVYNLPQTNTGGREISISLAEIFISDMEFVKADGTVNKLPGKKVLKTYTNVLYDVGQVPVGNYTTIRFKVGLDAATNVLNPTSSADSAILNKPEMWFDATAQPSGYVFLNVQGKIDTTSDFSAGATIPFAYKIGTNANYAQVVITGMNISVVKDQVVVAHMIADYNVLFNNVQVNQSGNLSITTTADNSTALAAIIVNNIKNMFKPE